MVMQIPYLRRFSDLASVSHGVSKGQHLNSKPLVCKTHGQGAGRICIYYYYMTSWQCGLTSKTELHLLSIATCLLVWRCSLHTQERFYMLSSFHMQTFCGYICEPVKFQSDIYRLSINIESHSYVCYVKIIL